MKAFEKWYRKQKPTQYEQPSCKDAWKAALEWILDQVEIDVVREELNNE